MSFKSDFPFRAQGMFDRFARFAEAFTTLSDLSLRFSCPLHCSSSCLPWFLAGTCVGLLLSCLGFCFLAVSVASLFRPGTLIPAGGGPEVAEVLARPLHLVRRARLAEYRE